jgi:hypothetical protein
MKFANATKSNRKSGEAEGSAVLPARTRLFTRDLRFRGSLLEIFDKGIMGLRPTQGDAAHSPATKRAGSPGESGHGWSPGGGSAGLPSL